MVPPSRSYQPEELIPGTVYRVQRLIGAGGMGTVYEVEDTTIGKRYVLKTLHPHLGDRQDLARRLQNEARTIARLNHPNIVEVVTAGMTGDDLRLPYYVMERLNGQSLRFVLEKKGKLELQHAYRITIDLLDALDHAHDKGVVHRDVKPDNIFLHRSLSGATVTKLLDFGIVSLLDCASVAETRGHFLGTLRYAAPEQLSGEKPSPQVDVYAAALVLFEMAAGVGPFDDEEGNQRLIAAHMSRIPPLLSRFVNVPPQLDLLLRSALEKDASRRPRDAFSFAASLRNLLRVPTPAPPDVAPRPTARAISAQETVPPDGAPLGITVRNDTAVTSATPSPARTQTLIGLTASGLDSQAATRTHPPTSPPVRPPLEAHGATPVPPAWRALSQPPVASHSSNSTRERSIPPDAYVPTASLRLPPSRKTESAAPTPLSPAQPELAVSPRRRKSSEFAATMMSGPRDNRSQSGQSRSVPSSGEIPLPRGSRMGVWVMAASISIAAGVCGFFFVRQVGRHPLSRAIPVETAVAPEAPAGAIMVASPSVPPAAAATPSIGPPVSVPALPTATSSATIASVVPKRPASKGAPAVARPAAKAPPPNPSL